MLQSHFFKIFDRIIKAECADTRAAELLSRIYSEFLTEARQPDLEYGLSRTAPTNFELTTPDTKIPADDEADLIYFFEKEMTIALEKLRADLFFIHGAALHRAGKTVGLIAPSGSGKSTTAWALLHHGFEYLSDELIPVDPATMSVSPYPHALCIKKDPPSPYGLPPETLRLGWTMHVPTDALPGPVHRGAPSLSHLFFVRYDPEASEPSISPVSTGQAAMNIYTNGLNQLAHKNSGLQAAAQIAQRVQAFNLITADLEASAKLVIGHLDAV